MKEKVQWITNMQLKGISEEGHEVLMDTKVESGGENKGATPKELVLQGLAGCTLMDVVSILRKMRALPLTLSVEVEATQTEEHPKVFDKIHILYIYSGDTPEDKMKRAVDLSQDQYCGVSAMLKKTAAITYEIKKI